MSKFEVEEKMKQVGLASGAVYTVTEAMETEQVKARNLLAKVFDEGIGEEVVFPNTFIKMSKTPGGIEVGAPNLGKHTKQYLTQLGYTEEEINALAEKKIIQMA